MIYMFLSNNPSSGDINSSNLPCISYFPNRNADNSNFAMSHFYSTKHLLDSLMVDLGRLSIICL